MPAADCKRVYIVAGEASGDLLTAPLVREMKRLQPDLSLRGVGGDRLQQEGMTLLHHHRELAAMGLVEVLRRWRRLSQALREVERDILEFKPDLLLLVDFPGFNLILARRLRRALPKIVYYISPKFWAWRYRRVVKLARLTDLVLCIFPFEPAHITRAGGRAIYEGHPLVDLVAADQDRAEYFLQHQLKTTQPLITFFPGSREQEIAQLLPPALEAAQILRRRHPAVQFAVHFASANLAGHYAESVIDTGLTALFGSSHNAMYHSDFAAVASGTANLETALAGTPQLMYYRFHPVSWLLARWLVKLEYASPVNIVMERQVIPELLQDALCSRLVKQIDKYLAQPLEVAQAYTKEYDLLRARLGKPGVTGRLAKNLQTVLYPTDTGINL
ncbi:MAG: lipid-A-disaccharide synthase [Candidatus Delongbacteria bacterium]|nr:lipid-A-disaccharide synthase [Candidatus Delongbacteria bacterium]